MNPVVQLHDYLALGGVLFALGVIGFLTRRDFIIMFLCAEMMLQGVAVSLVAFASFRANIQGQAFVLFILTVAACEAAVALALVLVLYRTRRSLDVSLWQQLREPGQPPALDEGALVVPLPPPPLPHLAPAGVEPPHRQETSHV